MLLIWVIGGGEERGFIFQGYLSFLVLVVVFNEDSFGDGIQVRFIVLKSFIEKRRVVVFDKILELKGGYRYGFCVS